MTKGSASIRAQIREINAKGLGCITERKKLTDSLEIALEMCERGISFAKPDLYKSDATNLLLKVIH